MKSSVLFLFALLTLAALSHGAPSPLNPEKSVNLHQSQHFFKGIRRRFKKIRRKIRRHTRGVRRHVKRGVRSGAKHIKRGFKSGARHIRREFKSGARHIRRGFKSGARHIRRGFRSRTKNIRRPGLGCRWICNRRGCRRFCYLNY